MIRAGRLLSRSPRARSLAFSSRSPLSGQYAAVARRLQELLPQRRAPISSTVYSTVSSKDLFLGSESKEEKCSAP